jgi:CCR4-NOT transcriptional complex subunit CAF120
MDVNEDTLPELQPIFTLLNSHTNKLYHEGYFLKLDDQDIRKCFAYSPPKFCAC